MPQKVLSLELLYSGNKHGWSCEKFHELCDDKGATITIMKSKANKIFGGFTTKSWKSSLEYI